MITFLYLVLDREGPPIAGFINDFESFPRPNAGTHSKSPIQWSLRSPGHEPAVGEFTELPQGNIGGRDIRLGLCRWRLGAGRYIFQANVLQDLPQIQQRKPHLFMRAHPKTAATWQRAAFNVAGLGQLAIIPALLIMALILISRLIPFALSRGATPKD